METFYLTPNSLPLLAKFLLSLIVTGYVLLFIKKNKAVSWFCGYLIGYTGLDLFAFLGQTIYSDWISLNFPAQYVSAIVMSFSYLQFSYLFKEEYFRKEHKLVQYSLGALGILAFLFIIFKISQIGFGDYTGIQVLLVYVILNLVWAAAVFFRKFRRSKKEGDPGSGNSPAFLSFFIITILALLLSMGPAFQALGLISKTLNALIFFVMNLVIFASLTVTFINYLADRTTVLVKLIGLSLVLFVTVIGLQGVLILPDNEPESISTVDASINSTESIQFQRQQINDQVEPYAWFLVSSILFILLIFPVFYSKSVLWPLKTLLQGIDKVKKGNLNTSIPIVNRDEIGYVTSHFNNMTESLREANKELTEYAEKLEERVKQRTEELDKQNKALAEVNEKLGEQTEELGRMDRFRTRLFMNISHELRTPITLISGPLEKIMKQEELSNHVQKQLKTSLRNASRLRQLVEQILDLNRLEFDQLALRVTELNVTQVMQFFASSFQSLVDYKGINYEVKFPSHPIPLFIDPDKFEKIIYNLISNAVKFTPKHGTISLEIVEEEEQVFITVSDTGKGIAPEVLPDVFNRFQTSAHEEPDYREGLGIGLAITKEYVELHKGQISVESTPGEGTSFTVKFKKGSRHFKSSQIFEENQLNGSDFMFLFEEDTPVNRDEALQVPLSGKEQAHLLVVEDNRDMAAYIRDVLEPEGYIITHAENGKMGLDVLKDTNPDLIISDIMMPVMDGLEFLKEIRQIERFKDVPTIFLSARSDMEGKLESLQLGVNDYLVKPFNTTELIFRIENLLEFSQGRQQAVIELSDDDSPSAGQELMTKLTRLVEEHIDNPSFTVEELASNIAMSRRTLYREIKKTSGFSAAAFVREVRLQKARQKLESGQVRSVAVLSDSVGFLSSSYFSKMYYKRFGKKPSDFLK